MSEGVLDAAEHLESLHWVSTPNAVLRVGQVGQRQPRSKPIVVSVVGGQVGVEVTRQLKLVIAIVQRLRVAVVGVFAQGVTLSNVLNVRLDSEPFNDVARQCGVPKEGGKVPCLVFVPQFVAVQGQAATQVKAFTQLQTCLLYTSDAADD